MNISSPFNILSCYLFQINLNPIYSIRIQRKQLISCVLISFASQELTHLQEVGNNPLEMHLLFYYYQQSLHITSISSFSSPEHNFFCIVCSSSLIKSVINSSDSLMEELTFRNFSCSFSRLSLSRAIHLCQYTRCLKYNGNLC